MVAALWSFEPKQLREEFGVPRHAIKLLYPLKNLNPTNKLAISDWIIKFCAAAGRICAMAFSDPVPRLEFRLHFKLTGAGFWDDMDGMSEVEFFDDLYDKYLERYAFINGVVASFIIGHVEWEKEPALARCIRDLPACPDGAPPATVRPCTAGLSNMALLTTSPRRSSSLNALSQPFKLWKYPYVRNILIDFVLRSFEAGKRVQ